jgi:hypothetical protein
VQGRRAERTEKRKEAVEKARQTKDMAMEALKGTPVEVVLLIDPSPSACPSLRILSVRIC